MIPAIYLGAVNGDSRQKELSVISENLANISTPGYKKIRVSFSKYLSSVITKQKTDFSQGDIRPTGNMFDVAISGKENLFFVVKSPDGKEFYTRRGDFSLNKDKKLIIPNGFLVQGRSGDIKINGSQIRINKKGEIIVDGKKVDKLRIVSIPLSKLKRCSGTLFYIPNKSQNPNEVSSGYEILEGYLEESNVRPVEEMIKIINCLRNYEECQKSIQSHDEATSKLINEVGIVRA